jgi:hypothetical protein
VVTLVLRTAGENPRWGCVRICGKLGKLGIRVGATTIRTLLRRHELDPVPRCCGPTWTQFLNAQVKGIVACDFLTVETIWLQTLSVLFFMHVSTRQVVVAGVTASPDSAWVTRQARNATMDLNDRQLSVRFMLRDHDAKFTGGFDEVFRGEGAAASEGRSGRRRRTPMPSGGCRPCGRSVWTGHSYWSDDSCCCSCASTPGTTTSDDRTARLPWPLPSAGTAFNARQSREIRRREVLSGLIHGYHEPAA